MRQPLIRRTFLIVALSLAIGLLAISPGIGVNAQTTSTTTYVVQQGDDLFRIAIRFGTTVQQIASLNGIVNPDLIYIGQTLTIPGNGTVVTPPPATGTATPNPPGGSTSYSVQPGDTLFGIALRYGTTVSAIVTANALSNPNLIYIGERLIIPSPGTIVTPPPITPPPNYTPTPIATVTAPSGGSTHYTVQAGDTLSAIAVRFGTTVSAILQANNLTDPNLIYIGEVLLIPTNGATVTPPPNGTIVPPVNNGSFETGGQIGGLSTAAQNAIRTAKMTWVKIQLQYGDNSYAGQISGAHGAGFKILVSIVGQPNDVLNTGYFAQFAQYVGQVAGSGADAIEVWNEENLDRQWATNHINAASYTQLLKESYITIKAVHPGTLVISGAPSPTGAQGAFPGRVVNDDVYYAGMVAAGAANYADCIGVHYNEGVVSPLQNSGDPRDNYPTRYFSTMLNRALAYFPGKQACYTEIGYLTPQGYGPLPSSFGWAGNTTIAQQAQWLGQAKVLARANGNVRLMIVFNINLTYYGPDDPQAGYAIIRADGSCPACTILGNS